MFNFLKGAESTPKKENMPDSEIFLRFRRHAKKESDPNKKNEELLLTPQGRADSVAAGKGMGAQVDVSVAAGSQMDRSQEAALLVMLANQPEIDETDSLDSMKKKIKDNFTVGTKIYKDERLGFISKGVMAEHGDEAFNNKRYVEWLINESDELALKLNDKESSTYSRHAGDIAEIFEKYAQAGNNFNKLVGQKDKYENFGNRLERYLGTHAGTGEAFIARVLRIQEGTEAERLFVQNNKAWWKELTGLDVSIKNHGAEQSIFVSYPDGESQSTIEVKPDTIKKIIAEKNIFNEKFAE